jgi:hypothetical protein
MLEIKSYDDWTENQQELDEPATNLKKYTDYVRSSYYKAGQLTPENDREITAGVTDRLRGDGLITDDMSDDDKQSVFSSVVGSKSNSDADARFVLDHIRTKSEDGIAPDDVKASTLSRYLTLKNVSQSEADGLKPYVDEILADKSLVKRARISAVDRGEYSIAALDEEDGKRTLYAGPSARPESLAGEVDSLLATGALSTSDLHRVNEFVKPINGGLSTAAENQRSESFERVVGDLAKGDKDINNIIQKSAASSLEEKTAALRTTGESIWEGTKKVVSYPFIKAAEFIVEDILDKGPEPSKYAEDTTLSDVLAGNAAINKRFTAAEIEKFSSALIDRVAGAPYRADRPETGIVADSMGNTIIAPQLLYNTKEFDKSLNAAPLNAEQKRTAVTQRKVLSDASAPEMLKMVLEENPDAAPLFAKAKADGLSTSEFLQNYVADSKNYDAFNQRLETFGKSAWESIASIPIGIAALSGNEAAAKEFGKMLDGQARSREFAKLHGDQFGLGFELINTLPQVATDIGLTIGTGGAGLGIKALAKTATTSARSMLRGVAKTALSEVDEVAAATFREASAAGGEAALGRTFKEFGRSISTKFGENAPLAAVSFTRSASSAYGSIYNQLPDDMSHEEKHKAALAPALSMGLSTAVITTGMSLLNRSGVESVATNRIRAMLGGETDDAVIAAGNRVIPVDKMNFRQSKAVFENLENESIATTDKAFKAAMRSAIVGTYKNWAKTTLKGGLDESFEEALDQAVGNALEDAALDRETPIAEKVSQVFNAGFIGGAFGLGAAGATQFGTIKKSEQTLVFEGRASAIEKIANKLRETDSSMTADVLQRRIDEDKANAKMSFENDTAIQDALGKFQERVEGVNLGERDIEPYVWEQAQFGKALKQPVWDDATQKWVTLEQEQTAEQQAQAEAKEDRTLLADIIGERASYGDFDGVLEQGPDRTVYLRLDKPYGKKGEGQVEVINLGPMFQRASSLVSQEPTFKTVGPNAYGFPDNTPYTTVGRTKEKFAFPPKDTATPEMFTLMRDADDNVHTIKVNETVSLDNGTVKIPAYVKGESKIAALARFYGLDIEPKPEVKETPEGQFEFGFANTTSVTKPKKEFGFGKGIAPEEEQDLTDEELETQTNDILGRSFAPMREGELELETKDQTRARQVLKKFDEQISSKQATLKKVNLAIKSFDPKNNYQKETRKQSLALKKTLTDEIAALKEAKDSYGQDIISLGTTDTAAQPTSRKFRSWDEFRTQMDQEWSTAIDQIRTKYGEAFDTSNIEDLVFNTRSLSKDALGSLLGRMSSSDLDMVVAMSNEIVSYATDTNNTATDRARKETLERYLSLINRIETVQEWVAEQEYRNIYEELKELGFNVAVGNKSFDDIIAEEEAAATKAEEEAAAAEAAKPKLASDLDTLHYLLSTKPQEIRPQTTYKSVADVNPRTGQPTNRRNVPQVFGSVVLKSKDPNAAPVAVQIAEYNAETKQVFYRDADTNELVGVPIRAIDVAAPDMRQAIDAFNQEAYEPVAEQKRQARSTAARRSIPLEKRVASFINKVSNYATQVAELNTREKDLASLPAARRSSVAKELSKQISALRSQATRFINQQGGILIQDMEWQKSLDEQLKQGTINSIREAIYGPEGYKSTSSRANVTLLRPESKIPTTKVILPKEVFRKGTQEETLVNELIQGGYDVNLPQLGQRLALNGMFETESGMMKYPAFSEATVELVEKEGDEVADANKYIKDKHVYLSEEVLKRFPQHGQFKFAVKAEKLRGKVASVGNTEATLESLEIELIGLKTKIENARISDAPVPDAIKNKAAVIEDQVKKMKSAIADSRYYAVGNKRYRTQTSKQMEGEYFPIEEETVRGETVTFGVFTNNPVITRAQIRAGYRIRIPDSFDMDNFNPSQHLSKDGGFVDGYYMPYEQEPYIVGTLMRTTNPNITEDGEQVMDLRVTENIARKELLVNRMVNPLKLKGAMNTFYASTLDSLYKRAELFLLKQAKDLNPRFPWSRLNIDNTITELGLSYAGYINEYRLAQNIVKKALGSLKWQHLVKEEKGSELVKRFVEEDSQVNYEYTYLQDEETKRSRLPEDFPSRVKVSPERRVVASFGQDITFSDLPASVRELVLTEEGNITDKIKQTNLVKFVTELMEGDVESIARDIKKVYNIKGSDPDAVIIEYARMLFIDATSFGGRFYSLPDYSSTKIFGEIRDIANKYSKQEQSVLGNLPLDVIEREGFDLSDLIGAAGNDVFQAMLDYRNAQQEKFGTLGADLLENSGSLDSSLRAPDLVYMDRASLLADELYKTVESDTTGAVGQAFRKIAESVGVTAKQMDYLSDSQVIQALANKLNTGYIFFKDRGAARIALSELSSTEAGKEAAGLLITRGWLPPVLVDGRPVPLRAPAERESTVAAADTGRTPDANLIEMARRELGDNATEDQLNRKAREYMNDEAIEAGRQLRKAEASTREIIDYSNQYMDAVNKLLPSIKAMSQIKSRELAGIEEARADIYDSYRMIRALVGAMSPEEGGMLHTKTKKEIAEGIELGAPFVTAKEVNNYLSRQVTEIEAEIAGLQAKRDKTEKLYTEEAPKIAARINEILNGTPDFTRDEAGRAVKVDGGGAPPLLETVKNKKERRTLLSELRKLQEKFTTISTYGMESMDSLDAAIEVKQKQLSKAEQRKNVATPVLLEELFTNISRAQNQIAMQRGFISRLSSTARNRIIEEQKMINRLSSLPAWKRYSQTITGLPVVAKQDPARSEKTERLIDALNESAAARQKLQEFADRERRELARTLIDNGVNLHNSGLLTTYVDPVDVETEEQVGEPVDLRFGEGEFSEAERAASTVESFGQATSEITLTGEERDRRTLEAANERFMDSYEENVARIEAAALRRKKPTKARTQGKMRKFDPNDDQSFSLSIIDPSLRDEARAENLKEVERLGLVSGDSNSVVNALKVIAKTGTERQKLIANLLSSAPDFIRNIRFGIVELDLGFAGLFDRSSNTVVVNLNEHNGRGLVDVLLHEYLHGSTVNVLLNPRTAAQRKAVARIEAIRNFAIANATRLGLDTDPVVQLGLNNNVEFLTYAFTAPEFQNILVGLTLPQQRTILRRIVDAILSVFGINPEVHTVAADAIQELFDFTKMSLAHSGTFSIDTKMKSFSGSAVRNKERALHYTDIESAERINDIIQRYNDGDLGTIFEAEGTVGSTPTDVSPIDALEEVRRIVPEGIEIEIDDQMVGAMGTRRSKPNTIFVNSNIVNEITSGLSKSNARSAVRSVVDEEVAHLASFKVFSDQDFIDITNEIGESMSNRVVDMLYSNLGLSFEEKQAKIAEDRESGALNSVTIGAEYVRGQMTLIAHGNTREQEIQFLYNNPTMMDKFLNAIKEFITMLKRRFKENPTVGTTAKISRASREFRRMRNGGVTPLVDKLTGKLFGDADDFLNALDGVQVEGNEDRTYYAMAVASTNPSRVATVWDKIQRKMYDSPLELKTHTDIRDGSINRVGATVRDFSKRWPKLRDSALNAGASMDELGKVLGTTAPAVQGQARTEIENKLRQFIKDNVGKDNLRQLVSEYEAKLVQPVNDKFYAQFRKEQKQTEDSLRARGFGEIVDYLVDFRKEINKGKEMIGFDESNDVYLTRTFKYFSTEGWAEATRNGGVIEIDGKTVDFNKMRAVAAKHYLREVELDAATEGRTLTENQKNDLTLKKLDGYLDSLDKRAEETKQLGPMNTIKRDINRLLQKKDVDEPLRELLGEVTDPFENAIRTLYSVGRLAANDRFLKNFAAEAIRLDLANYKGGKDMEMVFSPKAEPELGDLAGLYFRKDIATIIKQELGPKARDHETKSMEFVNGIVRGMSKFSGLAITSQTLGSVGFYPRNILGGMMLLASNGIVNPVYARQAVKLSLAANLKSADSKETLGMIKRLTELQVINDETRGRIVMDLLRGFNASTDEQLDELMNDLVDAQATGKVDKLLKRLKVDKAKQVGLKVVDVLAAVNDTIDGAMKVHAYLYELDTLTKAFGDTEPTEKLEAMAARKVKLTLPTHSDQVSIVKTFNRSPLAMVAFPFARWKSEVIRTMINIVPLAMEEINSGNDIMRARGVKRLLGFSSVLLGGGNAFGLLFGTLFSLLAGGDDEEEKGLGRMLTDEELEVVKEGLPEWQRNHGLFARMSGNDGVQVIDLTNILPLSMSTDLVKLGMAGNVKGMAEYITKEAIGAQIAATALYEVFNNKDDFDKAIASDADSAPVAAGKLTWHLLKGTMVPSVGKKLADITRYGQQDAVELVAGEITGARPRIHKRSDLEYTGMAKIKRAMDETQAILQPLSSGRGIDPADISGVIDDHQASSNAVQKRLNEFTSTMMTLGSTESDILTTASKLKISKQRIANAFAGTNSPWIPNKEWFKKMYADKIRGGEQDPNEVANELFRVLPEKADGYSVTLY